ncbi:MAG: cation diffusion facilitator family transporter [Anaerolineales bacterium]|jgi:cation diffusion facilitator family transporter
MKAESEKKQAASTSVWAAVLLTTLKLVVGFATGSLGILSEAAHSGLDLVAALVTYYAVRFSDQPADREHPYGHGKVENLSALIETLLLLVTCAWIVYEAIQRLFFENVEVEATYWAFLVMITSVVVDINRSRMLYRVAKKHNSQALEADALHFSTDIWSSLTVIGGLALVWLSGVLGSEWAWLVKADAVAALAVAGIVVHVSIELGKRAVAVLLDTAPTGLRDNIRTEVGKVPGIQAIGTIRVRQSGPSIFADVTIGVDRSASLEEAHQIAEAVEKRVAALSAKSDIVVHVNPVQQTDESLPQAARAIANRFGLLTHNIHAHRVEEEYHLDMGVEVPGELTLEEAHDRVSIFEEAILSELPQIKEINTQIEALAGKASSTSAEVNQTQEQLRSQIMALSKWMPGLRGCHHLRVWPVRDGYDVVMHCLADPNLSIVEAHDLAGQLEKEIMTQTPGVQEVLVHLEPGKAEKGIGRGNLGPDNWQAALNQLRGMADGLGLGLHDLHIHESAEAGYTIEVHLEFPIEVSLGEAHALAEQFEGQVKARWPQTEQVFTHLEPLPGDVMRTNNHADIDQEEEIRSILAEHVEEDQLSDLHLMVSGGHLHAAVSIALPAAMSLTEAHDVTEEIEADLLKRVPTLRRVIVHMEPEE